MGWSSSWHFHVESHLLAASLNGRGSLGLDAHARQSRCRWIRYPCNENAPSTSKPLLWGLIPENWAGQKRSPETSFLELGLFCWNGSEHGCLSRCLRKSAWGKPPVLLADPSRDRRSTARTNPWLRSGCTWWICPRARGAGAPQLPAGADKLWRAFHREARQGLGSFWLPGNCSLFKRKNCKKFLFSLDQNQIIYVFFLNPTFSMRWKRCVSASSTW